MCMEYFKKLQCYKPKKAIIDSPISIEEVALLQNSVDKDILGRIKFINRSQQSIIAIFIHLSASNIAGEPVPIEKERYIYQDMKIDSGELYGNKIPLHLPDDTRLLTVKLEKIVFENGEIWDASTGIECEYISQEEIDIPVYIIEKVQEELSLHFSHIEYIHYFYEEGQNFWECTCGKINSVLGDKCSFCGNSRQSQKEYLVQDKLIPLIAKKKHEVEDEKIRQEEEKKRLRKEEEQREYERKQKEWVKREAEEQELAKQAKKRKKRYIFIGLLIILITCVSFGGYYLYKEYTKQKIYAKAETYFQSGEYEQAIDNWKRIENFKDSKDKISYAIYQKAEELYNEKKYQEAIEEWKKIDTYKDSKNRIEKTNREVVYCTIDNYLKKKEYDKAKDIVSNNSVLLGDEETENTLNKIKKEEKKELRKEIFQSVEKNIEQKNYNEAKEIIQKNFNIEKDAKAKKEVDKLNKLIVEEQKQSYISCFTNPNDEAAQVIIAALSCAGFDIDSFKKYSGFDLDKWTYEEHEYGNNKIESYKKEFNTDSGHGYYILRFTGAVSDNAVLHQIWLQFDNYNVNDCMNFVKKMLNQEYSRQGEGLNDTVTYIWEKFPLYATVYEIHPNTFDFSDGWKLNE